MNCTRNSTKFTTFFWDGWSGFDFREVGMKSTPLSRGGLQFCEWVLFYVWSQRRLLTLLMFSNSLNIFKLWKLFATITTVWECLSLTRKTVCDREGWAKVFWTVCDLEWTLTKKHSRRARVLANVLRSVRWYGLEANTCLKRGPPWLIPSYDFTVTVHSVAITFGASLHSNENQFKWWKNNSALTMVCLDCVYCRTWSLQWGQKALSQTGVWLIFAMLICWANQIKLWKCTECDVPIF